MRANHTRLLIWLVAGVLACTHEGHLVGAVTTEVTPGQAPQAGGSARTCKTLVVPPALRAAEAAVLERRFGSISRARRTLEDEFEQMEVPIVFHVIHANATGYLDQDVLRAQISVLNAAYSGQTHSAGAATKISFRLHAVRYINNSLWYGSRCEDYDNIFANTHNFDTTKFVNIYTCSGSGWLGWASLPGYPERSTLNRIVLATDSLPGRRFSNYNEGDTAVHEIGHYFGLYHTFSDEVCSEDSGDYVSDTPLEFSSAAGCPSGRDSCPNSSGADPIDNFMDYSYDSCMSRFTAGQARRMREMIEVYRPLLLNNTKIETFSPQPVSNSTKETAPVGPFDISSKTCETLHWNATSPTADFCDAAGANGSCATNQRYSASKDGCEDIGARLCTANELLSGAGQSIPCGLSDRWVWSSTLCGNGSHYAVRNDTRELACGAEKNRASRVCCADSQFRRKTCGELGLPVRSSVCGASKLKGKCRRNVKYADAVDVCRQMGARLCSLDEIKSKAAYPAKSQNRCPWHTATRFWTSTPCARGGVWVVGHRWTKEAFEPECATTVQTRDWGLMCCSDESV